MNYKMVPCDGNGVSNLVVTAMHGLTARWLFMMATLCSYLVVAEILRRPARVGPQMKSRAGSDRWLPTSSSAQPGNGMRRAALPASRSYARNFVHLLTTLRAPIGRFPHISRLLSVEHIVFRFPEQRSHRSRGIGSTNREVMLQHRCTWEKRMTWEYGSFEEWVVERTMIFRTGIAWNQSVIKKIVNIDLLR
ncbi:hypothetical protein J6590_016468 [Homalodisca vitripennis]|nr:hypothetical protein J6590_016468 [Homalodisca vitripennis]